MTRPAAFLDRDGTLIEDAHYLADASMVRLVPGAVDAVRRLRDAGVSPVIVTNQSGIALGRLAEAQYQRIRTRVESLFLSGDAAIDASYHCPHHPDVSGPCDCRKPGTGMYRAAAQDHGLDVTRSLFAGDRRRDVEPSLALGGLGILVPSAETPDDDVVWASQHAQVALSLADAVDRYLHWNATTSR